MGNLSKEREKHSMWPPSATCSETKSHCLFSIASEIHIKKIENRLTNLIQIGKWLYCDLSFVPPERSFGSFGATFFVRWCYTPLASRSLVLLNGKRKKCPNKTKQDETKGKENPLYYVNWREVNLTFATQTLHFQ